MAVVMAVHAGDWGGTVRVGPTYRGDT
jgi:hypothetical protein